MSRVTWPALVVTLLAAPALVALVPAAQDVPAPPKAGTIVTAGQEGVRLAAARTTSVNNLKQIGLAAHIFHDKYNAFPAGVFDASGKKVGLSWRVAILPFIEQDALYREFKLDEPWDSDHNKKLIAKMPKVFAPPAGEKVAAGYTYYQMFT